MTLLRPWGASKGDLRRRRSFRRKRARPAIRRWEGPESHGKKVPPRGHRDAVAHSEDSMLPEVTAPHRFG